MRMALRLTRSYCVPVEERIEATTQSSSFVPSFRLRQCLWMTESDEGDVVVDVEYPGQLGSFFERLLYCRCVAIYLAKQSTADYGQDRRSYGFAEIHRFAELLRRNEGRYYHRLDEAESDAHDGPVRLRQLPEGPRERERERETSMSPWPCRSRVHTLKVNSRSETDVASSPCKAGTTSYGVIAR
ncbi:unnamed protein product [Spirodela intermedia]|uniref:Uncharacterized protein n=2 Tax=Spirodela intermedia TaxID=51605 RepID=A0A7I8J5F0_SPIIN|nr:unnamed protein product [Spirodela intermedia]CAA6664651.1 unnamed protein product [Spirodela intermedia]CAA7401251.1 unnamed protein product [Spirodela intermedia]